MRFLGRTRKTLPSSTSSSSSVGRTLSIGSNRLPLPGMLGVGVVGRVLVRFVCDGMPVLLALRLLGDTGVGGMAGVFMGEGVAGGVESGVKGDDTGGRVELSRLGVCRGERRGEERGDCCEAGGVGR